jgi:hypothetical protein
MHWLAKVPWLPAMIGWSVLILETGYAFFVWRRSTRMIWLPAVVAMHFSIGVFLGMWLFGLIMIIMNLGAFGYEAVNDWVQWRARFGEKKLATAAA